MSADAMNEYEMVELVRDTLGWGYGHDLEAILAQVRREAKVEALREEADALASEKGPTLRDALMIQRLHYRADQLEQEGKNDDLPYP